LPEATILAVRRLEQREPFAKINGSVGVFREQHEMGVEDHRSKLGVTYWHRGNNGKSCHELNPTEFQTELDTAQIKWGCNREDCWCRGGLLLDYACFVRSRYWMNAQFKSRARSLAYETSQAASKARSKDYDFLEPRVFYHTIESDFAEKLAREASIRRKFIDCIDTWRFQTPTDHSRVEWASYVRSKAEYKTNMDALHSAVSNRQAPLDELEQHANAYGVQTEASSGEE
jgi:hypothetical protein